jgi:cobalt-zinc-cadmium efflux system outer membrane protein
MTVSRFSFSLFALGAALLVPRPDAAAADSFVSPPSGTKLTFAAAFAEAMAQSPALRVIEADVESARGDVLTAQQKPASELTFSPGLRRLRDGDTANHEFLGSIELSRTFVFPGKRELLVSIAERNVALRQLATEGLRFQLTAAVRRAFAELLTAQGLGGLRQQQLESAQTFQQAAAKRAESGYASDFEAVKSQGDVINAHKLLGAAEGGIAAARVELNLLLGREPNAPLEVAGAIDEPVTDRPLPELLSLALLQNPSLRVQELQAEIAGLNVRKARLARKPDFTAGPALELSKSEQILSFSATLPLLSKDYGRGELLTANAEQRKVLAETERLRREISGAVAKAATELTTARAQLALYSPVYLDQLKAVVAQAEQSYAQNATSLLIYLDAKRTYFDTLADYYQATADVARARAELESAIGAPLATPAATSTP